MAWLINMRLICILGRNGVKMQGHSKWSGWSGFGLTTFIAWVQEAGGHGGHRPPQFLGLGGHRGHQEMVPALAGH